MPLELLDLTDRVIGCAIAVHRGLGPGFLESVYEQALRVELKHAGLTVRFQRRDQSFIVTWKSDGIALIC